MQNHILRKSCNSRLNDAKQNMYEILFITNYAKNNAETSEKADASLDLEIKANEMITAINKAIDFII